MTSPRSILARRPNGFATWICALIALFALAPSRLRADDEAWKLRIEKALATVEVGVTELDKKVSLPGTLLERINALHARLLPLEKAAAIEPGTISGKDDLSASTMDATNLQSRWKAVVKARTAPKVPPKKPGDGQSPPPPPPPPDSDKPPDVDRPVNPPKPPPPVVDPVPVPDAPTPRQAGGKSWPRQIAFKATAKMSYVQTGAWFRVETTPHVYESKFQLSGYSGKISFTLRATGLLRDVKSVTVRVAVRMKGQVTEASDEYRLNDVTWTAEKLLGDDSIKSWVNYDHFELTATPRWYAGGPRAVTMPLDAEAYVVSLVLGDGTELKFDTPEYNKPK